MLENIKILLGLVTGEKDELIELLISQATAEAKLYTNNNDVSALSPAITQMVIYKYNRLGTEGLDSEGYSGVSYSYSANYPDTILHLLKSCRKIKTL